MPDEVRDAYRANVLALLKLPMRKRPNAEIEPHILILDLDAQVAMDRFAKWVEPRLSEFGELGSIRDWGGKLVCAVARIAGILQMATLAAMDAPWTLPIS